MGRFHRRSQRPPKKPKFVQPFYDPGRPNPPYVQGSYWAIQEQQALPPFGQGYVTKYRRGPAAFALMWQQQLPQSTYCLLNPPPGPEPAANAPSLTIEVVEEIRVHPGRGAQVIACRIVNGVLPTGSATGAATGATMIAKLYDPLYYCHNGEYDILEYADMEYSREAAAYTHLQKEGVDGQLLPAYYGSFSMNVPLTPAQQGVYTECTGDDITTTRPVRLILTGLAEGTAMTYPLLFGDVLSMTDAMRMHTVGTCLEAYAKLYWHGLVHADLAPRNVFLREIGPPLAGNRRQMVFDKFVDLGMAYVLGNKSLGSEHPRQPARELRPLSPIRLFWKVTDSGASNMYYWVPDSLRNTNAFQAWMLQKWYADPRFEPIGPEPVPSEDVASWDTEKEAKVLSWAEDGDGHGDDSTQGREMVRGDETYDDNAAYIGAYNGDGNYPDGFW